MSKPGISVAIIIVILLIVGVGGFFLYKNILAKEKSLIEISGYYDEDGNEIKQSFLQSVIGIGEDRIEGVASITVEVNALNKDTTPLTFSIIDSSPTEFSSKLVSQPIIANPNENAHWESGLIDITSFEGTSPKFSVTIKGDSPLRKPVEKIAELIFTVSPNPLADFDVEILSPEVPASIYPVVETNAVGGWDSYQIPEVWIKIDYDGDGTLEDFYFLRLYTGECNTEIWEGTYWSGDHKAETPEGYRFIYSGGELFDGSAVYLWNIDYPCTMIVFRYPTGA